MGMSGIGIWQLVIALAIAMLIFGTSRLKNIGRDLGGAIKGFRSAMTDEPSEPAHLTDQHDVGKQAQPATGKQKTPG